MAFHLQCSVDQIDLGMWNKIIGRQVIKGDIKGAFHSYPVLLKAVSYPQIGLAIHAQIAKTPIGTHMLVQTSLLNIYSSFNRMNDAHIVFNSMQVMDIIAWNSMMDTYIVGSSSINDTEI